LLAGLTAAVHDRLGLKSTAPALEVGGACTGFLAALWLARTLLVQHDIILIVAVEAASRFLEAKPGEAGETAALFGDGAAGCLVARRPLCGDAVIVKELVLRTDGSQGDLLRPQRHADGTLTLEMQGKALAARAIRTMAQAIRDLAEQASVQLGDLEGIVIHGGNGRFPALLARQLGLPAERIWSQTANTGNLGSASLPVAWATHRMHTRPVMWCAIGAGLMWGTALTVAG
jgi:3-oxoacyl-[acyl-carrier-protein] synthase-3